MAVFNGRFHSGKSVLNGVTFWNETSVIEAEIGLGSSIGDQTIIRKSFLGEHVEIGRRNTIDNSRIGDGTYTSEFTVMKYATIGKYCAISWNVSVGGANHDIHRLAVTPVQRVFQEKVTEAYSSFKNEGCHIGNDVWLAAGCHILRNVSIGNGAVVGANSVVTKDIPPYAIAVGSPAKVISYRFTQEIIDKLEDIQWWNFPLNLLRKYKDIFTHNLKMENVLELEQIKKDISLY
jgi:acetyltransferase-like isoleucine patch superfamily enzyme